MSTKVKRSETNLGTWTARKLKREAVALHGLIFNLETFGIRDLLEYQAIEAELNRRGYEFEESKLLSIVSRHKEAT